MIKILPYKKVYQDEIDKMLKGISNEFTSSIFNNESKISRLLDKYWVALHKIEIIGTVGIIKTQNRTAILKSMFVKKAYRGKDYGVSNLLLQNVYKYCANEAIDFIYLGTMSQFKAAHKFYKTNGFHKILKHDLPSDFITNPLDDVFYKKALNTKHIQLIYRKGHSSDALKLKQLAMLSWGKFQDDLTRENWSKLYGIISREKTFIELLQNTDSFICETENNEIVGMAFIVSRGNPTDIYDGSWSYIRFVTVNPMYSGRSIGKTLTEMCIEKAKANNEKTIALHTSIMMPAARHIYEKLGFKIYKELEPHLGKQYWLYLLKLN